MPPTDHGRLRKIDLVHHSVGWNTISLSLVTMDWPTHNHVCHRTCHRKARKTAVSSCMSRIGIKWKHSFAGSYRRHEDSPPRKADILGTKNVIELRLRKGFQLSRTPLSADHDPAL